MTRADLPAPTPDARGWHSLAPALDPDAIGAFRVLESIDKLSIPAGRLVNAHRAKRLHALPPTRSLWLQADTTRAAIRQLVRIRGLETLVAFGVRGPGAISGLGETSTLRTLRIDHCLHARDLCGIAGCRSLEDLGAQGAELTPRALDALLALPRLRALDLECTGFDDAMAAAVSTSSTLQWLDLGKTRLSRAGLAHLVRMPRLRGLDVWATRLTETDLTLLGELPALEYVSLGGYFDAPLDGGLLMPMLLAMPALKRVWLDGVRLDRDQIAALEARFDHVRIS